MSRHWSEQQPYIIVHRTAYDRYALVSRVGRKDLQLCGLLRLLAARQNAILQSRALDEKPGNCCVGYLAKGH